MKTFPTYKAASAHLDSIVEAGYLYKHKGGYSPSGVYVLHHGEYTSPDYKPVRYKDGWGILKKTYYLPGTWNTPPERGRVDITLVSDFIGTRSLEVEYTD